MEEPVEIRYLFTYHKIGLKETATKKLLDITIDENLSFNEHITNICKSANRKLNALPRIFSFLSYRQKKVVSHFSSVGNSFGCLVLLGLKEKSANYIRGLCDCDKTIISRAMRNF